VGSRTPSPSEGEARDVRCAYGQAMLGLLLLSPVAMLFLLLGLDRWEQRMSAEDLPEQDV